MVREKYIKAQNNSYFRALEPDLGFLHRKDVFNNSRKIFDVFCYDWTVIVLKKSTAEPISFNGSEAIANLNEGHFAISIPPFRLVEWQVHPGTVEWYAYSTRRSYKGRVPNEVALFCWPPLANPKSFLDMQNLMQNVAKFFVLSRMANVPPSVEKVGVRVKDYIDKYFFEDFNFKNLSTALGIPHASMYRNFKLCFGLSPSSYRKKLRVYNSMRFLLTGRSATEACYSNGFGDFSTYYRNFKEVTSLNPSHFLLK